MSDLGWVNPHRKILGWEWYADINTFRLFVHMLLKANWKEGKFRGTTVPRGSFISSLDKLSEETSITKREIRTVISYLKMTGELTVKTTNKYSVFTVQKYDLYQSNDTQGDEQVTNGRQPNDILTAPYRKRKKEKKRKNINKNTMCKADALALFEKLWKLCPNKKGKGKYLWLKSGLLKVGHEEMARAIDRYKADLEKDSEWRKPQNGSTFFNSGYVDYLDENYADKKGGGEVGTDSQSRGSVADFYKQFLGTGDGD